MDSMIHNHSLVPERVSVVGPGRLGGALVTALRVAGLQVTGPHGRGEPAAPADAVLLCVPDAEIEAAALAAAGAAPLIGHTSGATGLDALTAAGGEGFGLHPLQTFVGGEGLEAFSGVGCAVAGTSPGALAAARGLAAALAMRTFELADSDRPAYHAAASIASNFLVTLEHAAEQVAAGAGLKASEARDLLAPLVQSTVGNWAAGGPQRALTGPVARGDGETVERQRAAVAESAPGFLALFDAMVERTQALSAPGVAA